MHLGELKAALLTSITELIEELQNLYRNIADQAIEHIHAKYTVVDGLKVLTALPVK
jgi:hypothetical protein